MTVDLNPLPRQPRKRQMMDPGVATAQRVRGWFPNEDRDGHHFDLPVWLDLDGELRIGMPKYDPRHGGDVDQVALRLSDLLVAIGRLAERSTDASQPPHVPPFRAEAGEPIEQLQDEREAKV